MKSQMTNPMTRTAIAGVCLALLMSACAKEGPAETAGKKLDNAAETVGDKVEAAGDKMENAADKAGEKIKDATTPNN